MLTLYCRAFSDMCNNGSRSFGIMRTTKMMCGSRLLQVWKCCDSVRPRRRRCFSRRSGRNACRAGSCAPCRTLMQPNERPQMSIRYSVTPRCNRRSRYRRCVMQARCDATDVMAQLFSPMSFAKSDVVVQEAVVARRSLNDHATPRALKLNFLAAWMFRQI